MLTVRDTFPQFKLKSVVGLEKGKAFKEISHDSFPGKWLVVFFWTMEFTFVCPTEIAEFGRKNGEFADRDAQVLGVSTHSHSLHLAWRKAHDDLRNLPFPMMADIKRELTQACGILTEEEGVALRA